MRMDNSELDNIRTAVAAICQDFPEPYWRELDSSREYPADFVKALTKAGYLGCLIPERWGGAGMGVREASIILEEICFSGGNAAACHAQMYVMASLLKFGTPEQKDRWLPQIADGTVRLQSFAVTEPETGSDTTSLETTAVQDGDNFVINGKKVWISRVQHSDLMLLLARTTPLDQATKKTRGLSAFLVDLRECTGHGLSVRPLPSMINNHSCELFFDNLKVPRSSLVGLLDRGFEVVLSSMNAERTLIAAECIGDGRYFLGRATEYARNRVVFNRPIGMNQGIQLPLAKAYAQVRAAELMVRQAALLFDTNQPCGPEANMAKLLAAEASWEAANAAMQTFGGFAFAKEYDIERKFRETRLFQIAPISTNLILTYLAEKQLDLPRSY